MKYIIIAYKHESEEYRCGCAVGHFDSDLQVIECYSEEELNKKIKEFQNIELSYCENSYELMVIEGGRIMAH